MPSDGREEFWCDPRVWYRLHDQTVELWIEETDEPESPDPSVHFADIDNDDAISNGDGTLQIKTKKSISELKIAPKIERLTFGNGLFSVSNPSASGNQGERLKIVE